MHTFLTFHGWKNFVKGHIGYVSSPSLRYTALEFLHLNQGMSVDDAIEWFTENLPYCPSDFDGVGYLTELKNIKSERTEQSQEEPQEEITRRQVAEYMKRNNPQGE